MANLMMSAANIIYLISYSVRDMLMLRTLMVIAMLMLAHCYWVNWHKPADPAAEMATDHVESKGSPKSDTDAEAEAEASSTSASWRYAFFWNLIFVSVNVFQIFRLIRERQPVKLTDEEKQLHRGALRSLTPHQVKRMVSLGTWKEIGPDTIMVRENAELHELLLIQSGDAVVKARGREIARIQGGQFVGEMSFLTKGKATAEVTSLSPLRFLCWPEKTIDAVRDQDPEFALAMQSTLGGDLVRKLLLSRFPDQTDSVTL